MFFGGYLDLAASQAIQVLSTALLVGKSNHVLTLLTGIMGIFQNYKNIVRFSRKLLVIPSFFTVIES
jgi:hypothetical protein